MTTDDSLTESVRSAVSLWRVANVIGLLLLIAILVPFLIYAVPQAVGAEHSFVVLSSSMEPTLAPGDVILVDDVPAERIQQGDIISFAEQGSVRTTTHRVIEVIESDGQPRFRTQGDANEDPDRSLVTPSQVEGRVMSIGGYLFVIPLIGYVIQFANTQIGIIALVLVPLTLLVVNEIWRIVSSTREGSENTADESDHETDAPEAMKEQPVLLLEDGGSDDDNKNVDAGPTDTDEGEGLTLLPVELRLGLVTLVAFTVYGTWVAYATLETWAFGVAGAVGVATILLAGLYFFGGSETPDVAETTDGSSHGTVRVEYGTPSEGTSQQPVQPVADFETLVEMARRTGAPLLRDGDEEVTYLAGSSALYRLEGPDNDQWDSIGSNGEDQELEMEAATDSNGSASETPDPEDAPEERGPGENGEGTDKDGEVPIDWSAEPQSESRTSQSVDMGNDDNDD